MQRLAPAKNARYVCYTALCLLLAFIVFIFVHNRRIHHQAELDAKNYAQLLSSYLWNIDEEAAQKYVTFIAEEDTYNSITVDHEDGSPFVSYRDQSSLGELDQYLFDIGLISEIKVERPMFHKDRKIGMIYTVKSNRSIYTYFYVALILLLSLAVIALVRLTKINRAHQIQVEHDLSENRERLQSVVSTSPLITFSLDRRGHFTVCEGMGLNKLHDNPEDIIGKSIEQVHHDLPTNVDDFLQALRGESFSAIRSTANRTFETWYTPMREDGHITGVIGVATDVTAAIQAVNSLHEDKQTRQNEHELAQAAHQAFLPEKSPSLTGYDVGFLCKPSRSIGGDYLHFKEGEHSLAFTFAEMSGHGVSSSLLAAIFHSQSQQILSDQSTSLEKAFYDINYRIHELFPEGKFASSFHARVDASTHQIEYVKASREPAILLRKEQSPQVIDKGGPALGLLPSDLLNENSFSSESIVLESNDTLFVYSDGLVEVENSKGKLLERKEIIAWLEEEIENPPQQIVQSIYRRILSHAGGKEILDDITMLLLRRS